MGRRKPAAAFSLFSFQDIVTSVTAILILVMLILSVELVSRRRQQAIADPEVTRRQLAATVEKLESLAVGLRSEVASRREKKPFLTAEVAQRQLERVREECDETRRRLNETRRTQAMVAGLRQKSDDLAKTHADDAERVTRLRQEADDDRQKADRAEEANRKETVRQANRRREVAGRPESGTELVYNPKKGSDYTTWLVELSGAGLTVVLLGGDRREQLGAALVDGSPAVRWIGELRPDRDYCLLLVRPSSSATLEEEFSKRLQDGGIRYGIDLIGEDQTVRDGSKTSPRAS